MNKRAVVAELASTRIQNDVVFWEKIGPVNGDVGSDSEVPGFVVGNGFDADLANVVFQDLNQVIQSFCGVDAVAAELETAPGRNGFSAHQFQSDVGARMRAECARLWHGGVVDVEGAHGELFHAQTRLQSNRAAIEDPIGRFVECAIPEEGQPNSVWTANRSLISHAAMAIIWKSFNDGEACSQNGS